MKRARRALNSSTLEYDLLNWETYYMNLKVGSSIAETTPERAIAVNDLNISLIIIVFSNVNFLLSVQIIIAPTLQLN